jgi:UDP-GlcNAc:undecaprenyl-phosphate GlcNAc-1-phosphate transferase
MVLAHSIIFIHGLLLGLLLTWCIREKTKASAWLMRRHLARHHLHVTPKPRLGGIAVFLGVTFSVVISILLIRVFRVHIEASALSLFHLLLATGLICALGVIDDLYALNHRWKFTGQIISGALFVYLEFSDLAFSGLLLWFLAASAMVFWLVLMTNAFNLIDGVDGVASGCAVIASLVVLVVSLVAGNAVVSIVAAALAGCLLGLLKFNRYPSTIFLGDCGSMSIGFLLGSLSLIYATSAGSALWSIVAGVICLAIPISDTALAIARRYLSGRSIFKPDCEHIHHRLLARGLTPGQTAKVLYAVALGCGLVSIFVYSFGAPAGVASLIVLPLALGVGVRVLEYDEMKEGKQALLRCFGQRHAMIWNLGFHRAARELSFVRDAARLKEVLRAAFIASEFDRVDLHLTDRLSRFSASTALLQSHNGDFGPGKESVVFSNNGFHDRVWTVSFDLLTSEQQYVGSLTLQRSWNGRPIGTDIALLAEVLCPALADSIVRVDRVEAEMGVSVRNGSKHMSSKIQQLRARAS